MISTATLLLLLATAPGTAVGDSARAPGAGSDSTASRGVVLESDTVSAQVRQAIERIRPDGQLRIHSALGRFHGYAERADAVGLHGLRQAPGLNADLGLRVLRWDEIERIDVRGSSARKGARIGAMLAGALGTGLGATIGAGLASLDSDHGNDAPAALVGAGLGFVVGLGVGAVTGAGMGAAIPRWQTIYVRP